jgi:hypothetical protein
VGRNGKKMETFPAPMKKMGVKTQHSGPHLLLLYWRDEGIYVAKIMNLGG